MKGNLLLYSNSAEMFVADEELDLLEDWRTRSTVSVEVVKLAGAWRAKTALPNFARDRKPLPRRVDQKLEPLLAVKSKNDFRERPSFAAAVAGCTSKVRRTRLWRTGWREARTKRCSGCRRTGRWARTCRGTLGTARQKICPFPGIC